MSYYKKISRILIAALFFVFIKAGGIGFRDFQRNFSNFQRIGNNFLEKKEQWSLEVGVEFSFNGFFEDFEFEKAFVCIAIGAIAVKFAIDYFSRKEVSVGHSKYPLCSFYKSTGFGSSLSPSEIDDLQERDFQRQLALYIQENAEKLKPLIENLFAVYEIYSLFRLDTFFSSCAKELIFDKENLSIFDKKTSLKKRFEKLINNKFKFTKKVITKIYEKNKEKGFLSKSFWSETLKSGWRKLFSKKQQQEIHKIDEVFVDTLVLETLFVDTLSDDLSDVFLNLDSPPDQATSVETIPAEIVSVETASVKTVPVTTVPVGTFSNKIIDVDTNKDSGLSDDDFFKEAAIVDNIEKNVESDKKFLTEICEDSLEINLLNTHFENINLSNENLANVHLLNVDKTNSNLAVKLEKKELELPPKLETVMVSLFEIVKDSVSETLKSSIENPKSVFINSVFGGAIFAYDLSKVAFNLGKIGCKTAFVDYEKGKNEFFEYTQPVANIINFISSNEIEFKDKAKVLTRLFFDIKTRSFVENSVRKGFICSLNSVSNKVTNLGAEFNGLYFNENNNNKNNVSSGGSKGHNNNYKAPGFHPTDTPYIFKDSIEDMVTLNNIDATRNHILRDDHNSLWKLITYLTDRKAISFEKLENNDKISIFKILATEILKVADGKFPSGRVFTKIELEVHGFKIMVHGRFMNDKLRISTFYLVD